MHLIVAEAQAAVINSSLPSQAQSNPVQALEYGVFNISPGFVGAVSSNAYPDPILSHSI
jgi:hypothetical protein